MKPFDIAPFALPRSAKHELLFEEPRDIREVVVSVRGERGRNGQALARGLAQRGGVELHYLQQTWPANRVEAHRPLTYPARFGWFPIDDPFRGTWKKAAIELKALDARTLSLTFRGLSHELRECRDHDVVFRRTLGLRIKVSGAEGRILRVHTCSAPASTTLRVLLDAGKRSASAPTDSSIRLSGYNARIVGVRALASATVQAGEVRVRRSARTAAAPAFELTLRHMRPAHAYAGDDGLVSFELAKHTFTVSLESLAAEGSVWYAEQGVYVAGGTDPRSLEASFAEYRRANKGRKTIAAMVAESPEQSFGGPFNGHPRPHPDAYVIGCMRARQRFWIEPHGDIVLHSFDTDRVPGKDSSRFKNEKATRRRGGGRLLFGLERWICEGRHPDPQPVLAYTIDLRHGSLRLSMRSFAVPLERPILEGELAGDDSTVALVRFSFTNAGADPLRARLPLSYSSESRRSVHRIGSGRPVSGAGEAAGDDANRVPAGPRDALMVRDGRVYRQWKEQWVLCCAISGDMGAPGADRSTAEQTAPDTIRFEKDLPPGSSCSLTLKIPHIGLDTERELGLLEALDYDRASAELVEFWRREGSRGARIETPEPHLDAVYAAHLPIVLISDFAMPDNPRLINTSVGTSTYASFANESCMIIHELDRRGLHEEARRRLELWIAYQGTKPLLGRFSDHEGVYFGTGGFEGLDSYCQNHGFVMWCLCEHHAFTGDDAWFSSVSGSLLQAAEWVTRQRKLTMGTLPNSRGWEHGFLPAGGLEDVSDHHYWLSTNALTWRGMDALAAALERVGHAQASAIRQEADAYRKELIRGFETMRESAPLVRLRDGRWIPNYPSRLYRRGRDVGWVRDVLEGSVYLLISGLYDSRSREAQWILDDFQDNRYMSPPYGYVVHDPPESWFDYGGFSIQPNLLAGLMPYLDRDEPELYIWMFFNAWCACYREEIGAMVEHPMPHLGHSNAVPFKTADQANAANWLSHMFVHTVDGTLHLGRAIPREWLTDGQSIRAEGIHTRFGAAGVRYQSEAHSGTITATVSFEERARPERLLLRIRHPTRSRLESVLVNGSPHRRFDPDAEDIDLTGLSGRITVQATHAKVRTGGDA